MGDIADKLKGWTIVTLGRRVDAFNHERITGQILEIVERGENQILIDLRDTLFLSLPAIKFFASTADLLVAREGELVLLAPANRTRKHIEIFANFNKMRVCMHVSEVETEGGYLPPKYLDADL